MADLRELEPFDERRAVQRMGSDVRAFLFGPRTVSRFIAMDVTILRLQSWRDTPRSFPRRESRSCGAVLKQSVKRASGRSRLWRRAC